MSVSWVVIPLDREFMSNSEAMEWLNDYGINLSASVEFSRHPTPNEIRQVLDSLPGYEIHYFKNQRQWTASISSNAFSNQNSLFAELNICNFHNEAGEEDKPHEIYFRKSDLEFIILVVEELSHFCGSFIIYSGSYAAPIFVKPGIDSQAVVQVWENQCRND